MKKGKINKKLVFLIATLLVGLSITLYITYAYYVAEINGNEQESTVAIKGGNLVINYEKNSGDIVASDIFPGWEETKTFTVSCSINYGDKTFIDKIWYDVLLIVEENNFLTGSLEYSLNIVDTDKEKEGIFSDNEYHAIETGSKIEGITLGSGYLLNEDMTHTYNLKIRYVDRDDVDQTSEMDAIFNARVNIIGSEQSIMTVDLNGGTLANFSLDDSSKTKVAKNSLMYIPTPIPSNNQDYQFAGWDIVDGSGTTSGNNVLVSSNEIIIKAMYELKPFITDSWETIASNIKSGNNSRYNVGDTREVAIEGLTNTTEKPTFTIRVANISTSNECSTEGFSQTACGFVVEFVDIVEHTSMNSSMTNVGGWPATEMRTYLNGDTSEHLTYNGTNPTLFSKLPSDLQSVIADTTVVSGHGSEDSSNFTSTDKLYLLSTREVWVDGSEYPVSSSDTAYNSTRQLDYYANNNVTTSNYSGAIKNYAGTADWWWLRTAFSSVNNDFMYVLSDGDWNGPDPYDIVGGVAPAFRIA